MFDCSNLLDPLYQDGKLTFAHVPNQPHSFLLAQWQHQCPEVPIDLVATALRCQWTYMLDPILPQLLTSCINFGGGDVQAEKVVGAETVGVVLGDIDAGGLVVLGGLSEVLLHCGIDWR
jgi:hypothetical protein